jgi:hypothetical protein
LIIRKPVAAEMALHEVSMGCFLTVNCSRSFRADCTSR